MVPPVFVDKQIDLNFMARAIDAFYTEQGAAKVLSSPVQCIQMRTQFWLGEN